MTTNLSKTLTIDRTKPFSFKNIGADTLEDTYKVQHEDPKSLSLSTIDLSRVRIEPILKTDEEHPVTANQIMKDEIARLHKQGFIFLDAKILETLLANPKSISADWIRMTDSDMANTAAIEFRGTIFSRLKNPDAHVVLSLFYSRGVWSYGHDPAEYSIEDITSFANNRSGGLLRYAAVVTNS